MSENSDLEKRIPVLTVLKNHSILKNIFILDPFHEQNSAKNVHEFEETLWIGRHPDCNIILEHPSISRFHLQIHFNPYSLLLSVTDLSSVHGTWVCGDKIEPNVRVYLNEGATLRLGSSSRIYRLHWVPMSIAYDLEQPFVPPMDLADLGDEKELEAEESQTQDASRDLDYVLSDMKSISSLEELITSVNLIPTDDAFYVAEGVENHGVSGKGLEQNETTELQLFNEAGQDSYDKDALVTLSVADQSQMVSLLENPGTTSLRSAQKTALSTWSGRGICASVQESIPSVPPMTVDNAIFVTEGVENHGVSGNGLEHSETSELQLLNEANQASNDKDAMGTLSFADQSPKVSLMENPVTSPSRSAEKPALSIWSRRGICASNEVFSWKAEESRISALAESEVNSTDDDVTEIESISRNLFPSENDEDDKENYGSGILSADDHYWANSTLENPETPPVRSAHKSSPFIWSKRGKSARVQIVTGWVGPDTEVLNSSDHDTQAIDSIPRDLCSWNPSDLEEIFTSDKENLPFDAPLIRSLRKTDQDNMKNELVLKSAKSISDEDGDEIFTPNKETWMGADTEVDSLDNDNHAIDSALKDLCRWTPNGVQEIFTPDKDILACDTPLIRSLRKPDQGNMNVLILKSGKSFSDEDRDETFTPDKENITPDTFRSKAMKKMRKIEVLRGKNSCRSSLKNVTNLHIEYQEPVFNNENHVPKSVTKYVASSFGEHEDEIFTPDKENITPDTFLSKSIKKMRELDEIKDKNFLGSSPLRNMTGSNCHGESCVVTASNRKNQVPAVLLGQKCSNAICSIGAKQVLQSISPKGEEDGVAYQSLEPTLKTAMKDQGQNDPMRTRSKESINHPQTQPVRNTATRVENTTRWTMVVDTASLLKKESRQALMLLQGVKRTKLIIPSTVMRELYSIKRCGGFFKRMNEASSALQWIEDCMEDANWWIHVESYAKEASEIATTPPVTPLSWFRGENRMFSTNWFSPSDTLLDNTSPTSDDHILESALLARTSMNGRLVLLSDGVTLKIKAMAEGLLCESAEQFREGLVNPFSERSLWADSSPRGLTWSCMDDVVLREKFYSGPLKNLTTSGQAVKGLKLILLQNSQDRKLTPPISSMA